MIKKILSLMAISILFFACNDGAKKDNSQVDQNAKEIAEVKTPLVSLSDFYSVAASYVDKEIVTQGIVDHVCRHGGKRLLLVNDDADLHIDGEERFDENLTGSEIVIKGIVREFRVDESYLLQMEEDNINSHKEGGDEEMYERKLEEIAYYRDSMRVAGVDHLSYYSMDYVSHEEVKE